MSFWNKKPPTPEEADCVAQSVGKVRDAEAETRRLKKALEYLKSAPWPEERGKKWVRDYCDAVLAGADMSFYSYTIYSRAIWPDPAICPTCHQRRDRDGSGEAGQTAKQAGPKATARARKGIAKPKAA